MKNTTLLRIAALLVLAVFSALASAAPVYLRCTLPQSGGAAAVALDITVDEQAQSVRMAVQGLAEPARAMASTFGPDRVQFAGSVARFVVDRQTLSFSRVAPYPADGTCTVAQPLPARRF